MTKMWSICKRELLSYFYSPIAYCVLTAFILIGGFFFLNFLAIFNISLDDFLRSPFPSPNAPNLNQWVVEGFYNILLIVLMIITPLLTMRLLAEDRRRGTFELLITSPVSVNDIVFGKFLGVAIVISLMVLVSWALPGLLILFCDLEVPPVMSGLFGVMLYAISFASIGMAASAFSDNQIVAGFSAIAALLILSFIHLPAETVGGTAGNFLRDLSPLFEVQDLIRGVITSKAIVYFVSLTALGIFLSQRAVEAQRWR